jgi:gamma-glutamyltranspeptidase/glutathione hydrolase
MYLDANKEPIVGKSIVGHLAIGIPGSVDGMITLHEKYGTLTFQATIQPAIDLAYNGFRINKQLANDLNRFRDQFIEVNKRKTSYTKDTPWVIGDTLKNLELAATLLQIRDFGRDGFYKGIVADMIIKESNAGHGIITQADLDEYKSKWRKPVIGTYKGHQIITMPPPSSGGIALIQLLQGAAAFDFESTGHNTPTTIHQMIELERRVYADRSTFLGDPDYYDVPVKMLLDSSYNAKRFSGIRKKKATPSDQVKEGKVDIIESVETTHFSVIDKHGNAVAITTTLNSYFGSKVEVQGGGFFLNNEMDDFSTKPGVPNQFGLTGAEANAIVPEKRMLSSMTPTLVIKNDSVKMVVGTPGGSTIITSVYQVILNVIDHGLTMQEAVNAPKFHSQWLPDKVYFEEGKFDVKTLDALRKMNHNIAFKKALGKLECIKILDDGRLEGAPDITRNESGAAGY